MQNYYKIDITIGFVDESIEIGEIGGPLEICVTASASDFVEDSVEVALNYEPISAQGGSQPCSSELVITTCAAYL